MRALTSAAPAPPRTRNRVVAGCYWATTTLVAAELAVGGVWDLLQIPYVRQLVTHLGYPSYFVVLLGSWKVLGAVALVVPRRALLKEWAYAGALFTYTGAIVSHLTTGYDVGEVGLLAVLVALTVLSWALRPPSRPHPPPHCALILDVSGESAAGTGAAGSGEAAARARGYAAEGAKVARALSLIVRNLLFTIVVPGAGGVYVPWLILTRHGAAPAPAAWYAVPVIGIGIALYLSCVWVFAVVGRGTPGPWDAPRRFVAAGPYRWVRNPIYLAALLIVAGEAWLFRSEDLLLYAGALAVAFHLLVIGYEEPRLRAGFGEQYEAYRRTVSRWVPHPPRAN